MAEQRRNREGKRDASKSRYRPTFVPMLRRWYWIKHSTIVTLTALAWDIQVVLPYLEGKKGSHVQRSLSLVVFPIIDCLHYACLCYFFCCGFIPQHGCLLQYVLAFVSFSSHDSQRTPWFSLVPACLWMRSWYLFLFLVPCDCRS